MTTLTLSLGPLSLLADQHGPLLTVTIHAPSDSAPVGKMTLTVPEWTALVALVDSLVVADRRHAEDRAEIERLRVCLTSANRNHEGFERLWYLAQDETDSLRQQVRELTEERDAYRTDAATIAEIVGIDPRTPGERRLLDEVAMHVRSTFESHRRLAHDLSAALVSVDAMAERIEQMRPVYERAVEWHRVRVPGMQQHDKFVSTEDALWDAVRLVKEGDER